MISVKMRQNNRINIFRCEAGGRKLSHQRLLRIEINRRDLAIKTKHTRLRVVFEPR